MFQADRLPHLVVFAVFLLPVQLGWAANRAAASHFQATDFGAVGDGKTLCTTAIQKAIDACAAAGGGTVWLRAGTYLSGTLFYKSRVILHLEPGCTLLGSPNLADYPPKTPAVESRVNLYCSRSLLYAENLDEIGLEGSGTLDGNGAAFHQYRKEYLKRPFLLRVINCRDVRVEGVRMQNSGCWNQHFLACQRVLVRGIRVWNHCTHNNDGVDIDGCRDFVVSKCFISSSDDGICLKSTSQRPCEGVLVSDCVVSSHANAIKMGTDSSGGFVDVTITNCIVRSPDPEAKRLCGRPRGTGGVALEIVDGGRMERVAVSNLVIQGVEVPIFVRLGQRGYGWLPPGAKVEPTTTVGSIKDLSLANIVATGVGKTGCSIVGLPGHRIENVTLSNVTIRAEGGGKPEWSDAKIEELPDKYPESIMFGNLPGYGLYCRHVAGLTLMDLKLQTSEPDGRHALVLDDVRDGHVGNLSCSPASGTMALIRLVQSQNVLVRNSRPHAAAAAFLKIEGQESAGLALLGNDLRQVARAADMSSGVPTASLVKGGNLEPAPR